MVSRVFKFMDECKATVQKDMDAEAKVYKENLWLMMHAVSSISVPLILNNFVAYMLQW